MRLLVLLFPLLLSAQQQPPDAYQIGTASNLWTTNTIVNLSNASTANLCLNTFVYRNDNTFIGCCSTLLKPGQQYVMSTENLFPTSLSFDLPPNAVAIKLVGSTTLFGNGTCNPSWPDTLDKLATGLRASIKSVPFDRLQLSAPELVQMSLFCGFIQANGSGFGICRSAAAVVPDQRDDQAYLERLLQLAPFRNAASRAAWPRHSG